MKMTRTILAALSALLFLVSCDVHEFPDVPATRKHCLRLHYETDLPIWYWDYNLQTGLTSKNEVMTRSVMETGHMRYIIRTYPKTNTNISGTDYVQEFVFTRNLADGYDTELELDIIPGEYNLRVWSDMVMSSGDEYFYNAKDFSRIRLQGKHCGNTDYRDAFRGSIELSIDNTTAEIETDTTTIEMIRPLAKYEFLSSDLKEFIDMEVKAAMAKAGPDTKIDPETKVDIREYKVKVIYPAFMPNTFSMFSDKPVDSATGVSFESSIIQASDTEASMGFDYVFVGEKQSAVTVQLAIYNKEGEQVSQTIPVDVPLKRGYHTLLRGTFLTQRASGGIGINPEFNGDHNIIL